jgi:hypothetical protein
MPASEVVSQLALRFIDQVQYSYEAIHGIVLADETITARSEATGLDRATIGEKAQFKIQLRLADAHFELAPSFAEIQERHAQFVQTFNNTLHWAHRERSDKLQTPAAVLGWVRGRKVTAVDQPRLYCTAFASPQFEFWEMDDEQRRKVLERQWHRRLIRDLTDSNLRQLALPNMPTQLAS